jgi:hypothetical protein
MTTTTTPPNRGAGFQPATAIALRVQEAIYHETATAHHEARKG